MKDQDHRGFTGVSGGFRTELTVILRDSRVRRGSDPKVIPYVTRSNPHFLDKTVHICKTLSDTRTRRVSPNPKGIPYQTAHF